MQQWHPRVTLSSPQSSFFLVQSFVQDTTAMRLFVHENVTFRRYYLPPLSLQSSNNPWIILCVYIIIIAYFGVYWECVSFCIEKLFPASLLTVSCDGNCELLVNHRFARIVSFLRKSAWNPDWVTWKINPCISVCVLWAHGVSGLSIFFLLLSCSCSTYDRAHSLNGPRHYLRCVDYIDMERE